MSRTAEIRPALTKQKRYCVRGHDTIKTGFYWNKNTHHEGVVYLTRRCRRCAIEDVQRCRKRGHA